MAEKRIDFRTGTFDAMIEKHGYYLDLYHSIPCPCLDPSTGSPDPNCPYCKHGWQYYGQEEIKGIVQNISVEKQFAETAGYLLGSMMLTVAGETNLAYHDRIVNRKSIIPFAEILTRGIGDTDRPRFPIVQTLRVLGKNGAVYLPGTDFSIDGDGNLQWLAAGSCPAEGEYYSAAYQMHPSWLCLQAPHALRDTHIKFRQPEPQHHRLPIQALCRLEALCEE